MHKNFKRLQQNVLNSSFGKAFILTNYFREAK